MATPAVAQREVPAKSSLGVQKSNLVIVSHGSSKIKNPIRQLHGRRICIAILMLSLAYSQPFCSSVQ